MDSTDMAKTVAKVTTLGEKAMTKDFDRVDECIDNLRTSINLLHPKEATNGPAGVMSQMMVAENVKEDFRKLTEAVDVMRRTEEPAHLEATVEVEGDSEPAKEEAVIRIDPLDQSVKKILLHFIENLTIEQAMTIVADGGYPHLALDELYGIGVELMMSLEKDVW